MYIIIINKTLSGVFPYEYLTSRDILKEECLPPIECFKSSLGMGRNKSIEDYQHAHDVWSTFDCTTFQDYMEVYVELGCIIYYFILL